MHSPSEQEPLPFVIRGSSTGNERATFFGANAASGSSKTIANLNLEGLGDKTLHDVLAQVIEDFGPWVAWENQAITGVEIMI